MNTEPMMSLSVAGYYARRVFELATQAKRLEKWRIDLHLLADVPEESIVQQCKEFHSGTADTYFDGVSSEAVEFACLLAEHGRLQLRGDIAREYDSLMDEYYGRRHAEVVTAVALDQAGRHLIESRLQETTGSKFVLDAIVDPSIVGGVVLKVGDRVIDRSVRARLDSLKLELLDSCEDAMSGL